MAQQFGTQITNTLHNTIHQGQVVMDRKLLTSEWYAKISKRKGPFSKR
ncbi:hypothetical protein A2U01_0099807, partial [Trifolium medium]|nr:hypothetical protein [Trifolium medium]